MSLATNKSILISSNCGKSPLQNEIVGGSFAKDFLYVQDISIPNDLKFTYCFGSYFKNTSGFFKVSTPPS